MLKEMKAYAHLKPGQRGTLRLVEKYGKALLCVRYRYDENRGVKLKTVEIIVDEKPLRHPRFKDDDIVPMKLNCVSSSKNTGPVGAADQDVVCTVRLDSRHPARSENRRTVDASAKATYIGNFNGYLYK